MKKSNFRNSFISTLTVTVVGVLLFGVNAALSETPTASPPGDGVAPTFTGLNLTGSVRNETSGVDYVEVDDGLLITGDALVNGVKLTVANMLEIGTDLHIVGVIKSPSSGDKPVTIDDGLEVKGYLAVTGNINNPSADPITIVDNVTISGSISNPGAPVTINDDLDVSGAIKNAVSGGDKPVKVEDGLVVTGKITATSIGTYSYEKSGDKTILLTAKALTSETVVCPTGYEVISCYGKANSATTSDSFGTASWWGRDYVFAGNDITSSSDSTPNDTCTTYVVTVKTLTATTMAKFKAKAVCYDSNI